VGVLRGARAAAPEPGSVEPTAQMSNLATVTEKTAHRAAAKCPKNGRELGQAALARRLPGRARDPFFERAKRSTGATDPCVELPCYVPIPVVAFGFDGLGRPLNARGDAGPPRGRWRSRPTPKNRDILPGAPSIPEADLSRVEPFSADLQRVEGTDLNRHSAWWYNLCVRPATLRPGNRRDRQGANRAAD
jgi:hypothetical protein